MNVISLFNSIRDIPYRIPLTWEDVDNCCSGKSEKLYNALKKQHVQVRYRVCVFLWSNLHLPKKIEKITHEDDCTHTFLEVKVGKYWKTLDPTWDKKLKNIFQINEWNGKSSTKIAVKPIKIFTPQKSLRIVQNQTKEVINRDLKRNGKFYKALNDWLESKRKQKMVKKKSDKNSVPEDDAGWTIMAEKSLKELWKNQKDEKAWTKYR